MKQRLIFALTVILVFVLPTSIFAEDSILSFWEKANGPLFKQFDLDFKGGTLQNLLAEMERKIGTKPNIVVDDNAKKVRCPQLSLKSVTAFSLVNSLEGILSGSGHANRIHAGTNSDPAVPGAIMFISSVPAEEIPAGILTQIHSLEKQLKRYSLDDIITAIETAWQVAGVQSQPKFKFHKETNLLLVKCATHTEVIVLETVLDRLK